MPALIRSTLVATLALCALQPVAQAQDRPAINPLYLVPADQATPAQITEMQQRLLDWPQLQRYRGENAALTPVAPGTKRVVFYGDSITEGWGPTGSERFFPG